MDVLAYSPEGARAYFALETSKALSAIEQATNTVPLRQVARSLKLLGHMICGQPVQIESLAASTQRPRLEMKADGPLIYLPSLMNRFSVKDRNIRSYTVTLAHEMGHVEFGTYRIDLPLLRTLAQQFQRARHLSKRHGHVGA